MLRINKIIMRYLVLVIRFGILLMLALNRLESSCVDHAKYLPTVVMVMIHDRNA